MLASWKYNGYSVVFSMNMSIVYFAQ